MTVLSQIVSIVRSGVFHVVYLDASSRRLGSGTAFMSKGLLVTNGHLLELPPSTTDIWLRQDHHRHQNEGICLRKEDFINRMLFASPPEEYDYAALEIPELIASSTPYQFKITKPTTKMIGEDVAFLGYPLRLCHKITDLTFY